MLLMGLNISLTYVVVALIVIAVAVLKYIDSPTPVDPDVKFHG